KIVEIGHRIRPAYVPVIEPYVIEGKHVLVLWAPGGQTRPYKAPESLAKGNRVYNYYIRAGTKTIAARGNLEQELLGLAAAVPFDDRVQTRATLDDLQIGLIREHLRAVGSDLFAESAEIPFRELCDRMKIIDGPPERPMPRNVGLMFFSEDPQRFFPGMQIDIAIHPEGLGGDRIVEKIFRGPLAGQIQGALQYLEGQVL